MQSNHASFGSWPRTRYPEAFTLLELLATVAIIATLAALVVPFATRTIDGARSTKCLGNLRQLAAASAMFHGENDGYLIPICRTDASQPGGSITWRGLLLPYLGGNASNPDSKVFICPSDRFDLERYPGVDPATKRVGRMPTSYAINAYGINSTSPHEYFGYVTGKKITSLSQPASTLFVIDAGVPDSIGAPLKDWTEKNRSKLQPSFGYAAMPNNWTAGNFCIYPRHNKSHANALFHDGHIASVNVAQDVVAHPPGDPKCLYDYH